MPAPAATFGTPTSYIPVEYPKAGRNTLNQSASAKDPEHQKALESAGFVFPEFVPWSVGGNVDHVGRQIQEYPRAMYNAENKTALARNPGHQTELEENGWSATPRSVPVIAPNPQSYGMAQTNPPLSDAMTAEIAELRTGHSAKIGELQAALGNEKKSHAATKSALDQANADKEAVQAQLDKTASKSKSQMQKDFDDLQAKYDALELKFNELKMANDQLLLVVGKPAA